MTELIIHLGYPKTATTTIQENFFSFLDQEGVINYLGKSDRMSCEKYKIAPLLKRKSIVGDLSSFTQLFKKIDKNKLNVISDEDFLLSFFNIDNQSNLFHCHPQKTLESLEGILSENLPDVLVKIIVTIRSQKQLIHSTYVQGFKAYFSKEQSIYDINDYLNQGLNKGEDGFFLMYYFYQVLKPYADVFGKSNIKLCIFEDLNNNPEVFADDFCAFFPNLKENFIKCIEKKENTKNKNDAGYYLPSLNLYDLVVRKTDFKYFENIKYFIKHNAKLKIFFTLFRSSLRGISVGKEKNIPYFTEDSIDLIEKKFFEDNNKLIVFFDLDSRKLIEYGYIKKLIYDES